MLGDFYWRWTQQCHLDEYALGGAFVEMPAAAKEQVALGLMTALGL